LSGLDYPALVQSRLNDDEYRDYYPSDFPDLFIRFSEIGVKIDAILDFANEWGALGDPIKRIEGLRLERCLANAESLMLWRSEIAAMNRAVEMWLRLKDFRSGSNEQRMNAGNWMKQHIIKGPRGYQYREDPHPDWLPGGQLPQQYKTIASSIHNPSRVNSERFKNENISGPAEHYLVDEINNGDSR